MTLGAQRGVLYPDVPNNYRSRLDLQWPIYTAGRADALERAARAEVNAVGADLDAARADLKLEITRAYWALVTARETEQVVARSLESLDTHLRDLRARLDQGLIPRTRCSRRRRTARVNVSSRSSPQTRAPSPKPTSAA